MNRWDTRFGVFVDRVGVARLQRALKERGYDYGRTGIYHWVKGDGMPPGDVAMAIAEISAGELTITDVFEHCKIVGRGTLPGKPNPAAKGRT